MAKQLSSNPSAPIFGSSDCPSESGSLVTRPLEIPELWHRSADGLGIERNFKFKTFKTAWKFMNDVAAEAQQHRHHPEWSNIYNKVFVRWSTHDKGGLTDKDVRLARICNDLAYDVTLPLPEGGTAIHSEHNPVAVLTTMAK